MKKRGEKGKFGQFWADLGKFGQVRTRQQIRKIEKAWIISLGCAKRIRKGNKNFSGNWGTGGESRV